MNLKLSNQTIELDTQKLTEEDKKKLIEALEDDGAWQLEIGELYWTIEMGAPEEYRYRNDESDKQMIESGLAFQTKEAAEKHLTYLKALQVLKGDTKGYEWKSGDEYYVGWLDIDNNELDYDCYTAIVVEGVRFNNSQDIVESFKLHEKEWRIVLLGGDK